MKNRSGSTHPLEVEGEGLDEVLQFLRLIWAIDHGLNRASKRMERDLGITGPQRLVLRFVGLLPGITPGRLASILCLHPSTLTVILRSLERRNLVKRRRSPSDGRSSLLKLTSVGRILQRPFSGTVESLVKEILSKFDAETIAKTRCVLSDLARILYDRFEKLSGVLTLFFVLIGVFVGSSAIGPRCSSASRRPGTRRQELCLEAPCHPHAAVGVASTLPVFIPPDRLLDLALIA